MPTLSQLREQTQSALFSQINLLSQAAGVVGTSANQAADIMQAVVDENISYLKDQYSQAQAFFTPYSAAGTKGLNKLQDLLGLNGSQALAAASQEILQAPDVQQAIQLGVESYQRSAAAGTQGIRSGRLAQELQQFGQNTAFGAIQQRRSDLYNVSQMGLQAATNQANLSVGLGQDVSNQRVLGGEARANAKLIAGQATANALTAQAPLVAALQAPFGMLGGGGVAGAVAGGGAQYQNASSIFGNGGGMSRGFVPSVGPALQYAQQSYLRSNDWMYAPEDRGNFTYEK